MNYYVWRGDIGLSKKYFFADTVPPGMKHALYKSGKAITPQAKIQPLVGKYAKGALSDMVLTQFPELPILSPKAIKALQAAGVKNFQLLPIAIDLRGKIEKSYKIANIIGKIACLDRKRAKVTTFDDGALMSVERFALLPAKLKKAPHVFRLGEFSQLLIVDDVFKEAFEKAGLTGGKFTPTEKYT